MGIFSFLKRKNEDELEIPPPPPPSEALKAAAPQLVPEENILPLPKRDIPAMPSPDHKIEPRKKMGFPEFPSFLEPEQEIMQQPHDKFEPIKQETMVVHPIERQKPVEIKEKPKETEEVKIAPRGREEELKRVSEEKHFLKEPIFVKTDQYQNMIDGINEIKNKIKECGFFVADLNDIKNKKDKEFNKWRSNLEDMQRKVSIVEKSLFEVAK